MKLRKIVQNISDNSETLRQALRTGSPKVLFALLGPAVRGFALQKGKSQKSVQLPARHKVHFNWEHKRDQPALHKLYNAAKRDQWVSEDLAWDTDVDPLNPERELIFDSLLPLENLSSYRSLSKKDQAMQRHAMISWILSQIMHGEQGALFAACQVTEAVQWSDGKFYGSTQVVDEGRHVEVFHRYLTEKLGRVFDINDNLYVVVDALISDGRWDLKFLGMQIMIEGLALGAFSALRASTKEPLLRELLRYVITDEARHVHFGVVALREYFTTELSPRERKEREDWAFEIALLMGRRILAHEFYEEYYGHEMSRATWDKKMYDSGFMVDFRHRMYRRLMPNLKRIGLISDRIRPHYESIGILKYENGPTADELSAQDLLDGS